MTHEISKFEVIQCLRTVMAPGEPGPDGEPEDIITREMVSGLSVEHEDDGIEVRFMIEIDPAFADQAESLRTEAIEAVHMLPDILKVDVVLTSHQAAPEPAKQNQRQKTPVKHVIAVASGKGGVGKSTTAVNLALALSDMGLRVGLLDADIFGPSVPRLLGASQKPEMDENRHIIPIDAHGILSMSIGYLVDERAPVIWRGPMVHGAIKQLCFEVAWGELDALIVDMPPGTGDAALTLARDVPLAGAVIVSTPQDIALIDARKALAMFEKAEVPILGIVENMSGFVCPHCGETTDIFSRGGARAEAEEMEVPFLGSIPLDLKIRETSDAGTPIVVSAPQSAESEAYRLIAARLWEDLEGN